ncbi:MAG: winged helix-turn-helix domain-containing protein [Alphaproteobacteria bacterium]
MIYRFDDFELDTDRFELRHQGNVRPTEPQVFALLELLVANHRRVVSKDEINLRVWGGRVVSEAVLSSRIRSVRLAIGDDGSAQRLIRTVHNRGFRFVGKPVLDQALQVYEPIEHRAEIGESIAGFSESGDDRPSIAVLPFEMLSHELRYEALADAVAHDLIVELSRLHWLFVIARGSSFRFRGPSLDLPAIGAALGVRYCLTGSLAIHGKACVVTVELARTSGGRVVWADRFEGPLDDLLTLRTTIAARIVTAVEVRIPMDEALGSASQAPASLGAWAAYHRGLWHMLRFNRHDNEVAATMFQRAIDADPEFARAHAGLSFTHFQNAFIGYTRTPEADRKKAKILAERGLELDPMDPFANLTMGRADWLNGDIEGCRVWLERSIALNPNYAFAIYNCALVDTFLGKGNVSERGVVKAMALSPLDPMRYAMLATRALSHVVRGDYEAASAWAERAATAPNAHIQIRVIAALAHELAGHRNAAARWAAEVLRMAPDFRQARFIRAFPFRDDAVRGKASAALKRLRI